MSEIFLSIIINILCNLLCCFIYDYLKNHKKVRNIGLLRTKKYEIYSVLCYNITKYELRKYKIRTNRGKMANKTTVALTQEQYKEIIDTMKTGGVGFRPNNRIATALVLEANLGLRIEDILDLKLKDIIADGNRYRLNIKEKKTSKKRTFTVPLQIYNYIKVYAVDNKINDNEKLFPIGERAVQKYLSKVVDYLGYENIGTHSFRKFFATEIYLNNNYNIILVQQLLQHSSVATTQKYVGITSEMQEKALMNHINLM